MKLKIINEGFFVAQYSFVLIFPISKFKLSARIEKEIFSDFFVNHVLLDAIVYKSVMIRIQPFWTWFL